MLFFRSEDTLKEWCNEHGHRTGPVVSMEQLWAMARTWYANRLQPDARRPGPDEIRTIFASLGLEGEFWNPQADTFG